ncbi:MAG TPA: hypothetical protein VGM63_20995, partial [Mucilaginibacter sp.]
MLFKKILLLGCLFVTVEASAQTNIILKGDTLILPNGAKFWKGEEVTLGDGSAPDRSFLYVYQPEVLHLTKKKPAASIFSTRRAIIKKFQKDGEYKHSYSYNIIVLDFGDIRNYWCDVQNAVDSKELVTVSNSNDRRTPVKQNVPPSDSKPKKDNNKPVI